jgi:flagellar assembly protein FliH
MSEIRPFELKPFDEEVRVQADLEKAREQIKATIAERDAIRERARLEGLELGRREGLEIAAVAERERVERETSGVAALLRGAAVAIGQKQAELAASAERDLLRLALAIAAKVVKAEIKDAKVAGANLRRAIELTARRQELTVRVHPEDLALIEAYLPELRREFSDVERVALEADPTMARGGAVVRTREGSVDASIDTQLAEIERGLLG